MPIYRCSVPGAKPILMKAASAAKARDTLVDVVALKSEEIIDLFSNGAKVFKDGDRIEVDPASDKALGSANAQPNPQQQEGGEPKPDAAAPSGKGKGDAA